MDKEDSIRSPYGTFLAFETTHLTMKAESILKAEGIPLRLFPKPRSIISECGLIVKVLDKDLERVSDLCRQNGLKIKEVLELS